MKKAVKVPVLESERGWGSKIDDHMVCLSISDAETFIKEFNADNNLDVVPDWYMVALAEIMPIDLTDEQFKKLEQEKRIWLKQLLK